MAFDVELVTRRDQLQGMVVAVLLGVGGAAYAVVPLLLSQTPFEWAAMLTFSVLGVYGAMKLAELEARRRELIREAVVDALHEVHPFVELDDTSRHAQLHIPTLLGGRSFLVASGPGGGLADPVLSTRLHLEFGDARRAESLLAPHREVLMEATGGPGHLEVSEASIFVRWEVKRSVWQELEAVREQALAAHELAQLLSLSAASSSASGSPKRR